MTNQPILHPLAAYLRDSGGDAQELSTSQQESELRRWAAENGYTITHWFRDEARPGSSVIGRKAFQEMMKFFRTPGCPVEGLVVWKFSRIARDVDDAQYYKADLRRSGYRIFSLGDPAILSEDTPEARLLESVTDYVNHRFLIDLSIDVRRGLLNLVQNYGAVPGSPPRGFKREPIQIGLRRSGHPHIAHRWVIDPETSPLVRHAFEMRAAGAPLAQIMATTRLFKSVNSFTSFFRNKIYIGILEFGELTIENYCEPLIPIEIWNAVQQMLAIHANHINLRRPGSKYNPQRQASRYLLSGLLVCGQCNSPMNGLTVSPAGKPSYDRYICSSAKRRRDCKAPGMPAKPVEAAVLSTIVDELLTPDAMLAIQQTLADDHNQHSNEYRQERLELAGRLSGVRRRIANITDVIAEGNHNRAILQKLTDLEIEENDLLTQIQNLSEDINNPPAVLTPEQIRQRSQQFQDFINSRPPAEIQTFLRGFIEKIVVTRTGQFIEGVIHYHALTEDSSSNKSPPDDIINTSNVTPGLMSTSPIPMGAHYVGLFKS